MIPAEIIKLKRNGYPIPKEKLNRFINHYVDGTIPEYQMAALLMAIYFNGMDDEEIFSLVDIMLNSGERIDFSNIDGYLADKHSTGGVGDKVSIILGPLMAAAGLVIPMISGRSLGHTGGTLDKLETIPGFQVDLTLDQFKQQVESIGIAMIGQTEEICPADKKMYALRDVTGTIESVPLICGSIMSKKIAEGIDGLVLDIKFGNGAFMKTIEEARNLGRMLKRIGSAFNVKTDAVYSSMNQPLGRTAGLWCEMYEAIEGLLGKGSNDTLEVTYELGARLLIRAGLVRTGEEALRLQQSLIDSGQAYQTFLKMVKSQNGNLDDIEKYESLHLPRFEMVLKAPKSGIIQQMDTYRIGLATVELGSGRKKVTDMVDATAGLEFIQKIGAEVSAGDPLIRCFNSDERKLNQAIQVLENTIHIGEETAFHTLLEPEI